MSGIRTLDIIMTHSMSDLLTFHCVVFLGSTGCILPEGITELQLKYPTTQILNKSRIHELLLLFGWFYGA
jgi:hypothetical protein